jgi:RimJ/RimL family protein N-acetyltransferase
MRSSPDVARYLYWDVQTPQEVRAALETKIGNTAIRLEDDVLALAVVRKDGGETIGDVILAWVSREHGVGEIGFIIDPHHAGHGFATEAARPLLSLAFNEVGLHRVIGRLDARNRGSARVLEKLGMRRESHLVENEFVKGEWQSELGYAILDREWREMGS